MPKFAANLTMLFTELPYLDRFDAAAEVGFAAVEILAPYDVAAKETRRALLRNGLTLVLINAPPPNYTGGVRGYAAEPGNEARFEYDMRRTLRYARELQAGLVHIMSGYSQGDVAEDVFVRNLKWAADFAPEQQFTIEPLNPGDQPGYFLNDYDLAARVLDRVDRPNLGLQYDSYHAQLITGDALATWYKHQSRITHVQIGSPPDRGEPGDSPFDFASLFAAIDASGYTGWVSGEYHPSGKTVDSLAWLH